MRPLSHLRTVRFPADMRRALGDFERDLRAVRERLETLTPAV